MRSDEGNQWIPIQGPWFPIDYRDFHDVPRLFWIAGSEESLLFDCPFSNESDDYPDHYEVYVVPLDALPSDRTGEAWALPAGTASIARVAVKDVEFDDTRRRAVRGEAIARLTSRFAKFFVTPRERVDVEELFAEHGYDGPLATASVSSDDERVFVLPRRAFDSLTDVRGLVPKLQNALGRKVWIVYESPEWGRPIPFE